MLKYPHGEGGTTISVFGILCIRMIKKAKNKIVDLYKKHAEIAMYIVVGGITTAISLATKFLLLFTILDASNELQLQVSVIISWIVAVTSAYFMNRKWVFKSQEKNIMLEATKFYLARVGTLVLEMVLMWFFINLLGLNSDVWVIIVTFFVQVLIMVGNYILSKIFVFAKNKNN